MLIFRVSRPGFSFMMNKIRFFSARTGRSFLRHCPLLFFVLLLFLVPCLRAAAPLQADREGNREIALFLERDGMIVRTCPTQPGVTPVGPGQHPFSSLDGSAVLAIYDGQLIRYREENNGTWSETDLLANVPGTVRWYRNPYRPDGWLMATGQNLVAGTFDGEEGVRAHLYEAEEGTIIGVDPEQQNILLRPNQETESNTLSLTRVSWENEERETFEMDRNNIRLSPDYRYELNGNTLRGMVRRSSDQDPAFVSISLSSGEVYRFDGLPAPVDRTMEDIPGIPGTYVALSNGTVRRLIGGGEGREAQSRHVLRHHLPGDPGSPVPCVSSEHPGVPQVIGNGRWTAQGPGETASSSRDHPVRFWTSYRKNTVRTIPDPLDVLRSEWESDQIFQHLIKAGPRHLWAVLRERNENGDDTFHFLRFPFEGNEWIIATPELPGNTRVFALSFSIGTGEGWMLIGEEGHVQKARFWSGEEHVLDNVQPVDLPVEAQRVREFRLFGNRSLSGVVVSEEISYHWRSFDASDNREINLTRSSLRGRDILFETLQWIPASGTLLALRESDAPAGRGLRSLDVVQKERGPDTAWNSLQTFMIPTGTRFQIRPVLGREGVGYLLLREGPGGVTAWFGEGRGSPVIKPVHIPGSRLITSTDLAWYAMLPERTGDSSRPVSGSDDGEVSLADQIAQIAPGKPASNGRPTGTYVKLLFLKQAHPDRSLMEYALGIFRKATGSPEKALTHFEGAHRRDTEDPRYRRALARTLTDLGRSERAIRLYKNLYEEGYRDAELLYHYEKALAAEGGERSRRITLLEEAVERKPDHPDYRYRFGTVWAEQEEDYERAAEQFEAFLEREDGTQRAAEVTEWLEANRPFEQRD